MNRSERDDGQPGLWPIAEPQSTTTAHPRRKGAAPALSPRQTARQSSQAIGALNERKLWSIDDVALYLGVPRQTIYGWRQKNYGPPAIKVGKHLRWQPATVVAWAKQQERPAG